MPNLLGLKSAEEIALSEFEGFLKAEIVLTEDLSTRTKFSASYIQHIHKLALGRLYPFAGKYRDVNLSKGGFPFAAARFLNQSTNRFEVEVLSKLPNKYSNKQELIHDIAVVHGELLRKGNGRTARVLANLLSRKQGFEALKFDLIDFDSYVLSVQRSAKKDYTNMIELITSIFPSQVPPS